MTCTSFIATSMDGFIAREDGGIDWLTELEPPPGEDYGYAAFMATVDVLVMGRNTYEKMLTFPEWYYGDKPVVVLTRGELEIPKRLKKTVSTMHADPVAVVAELHQKGARHLYVDGGVTVQGFLNAGLLDQFIITRIAILLGRGIPLFGRTPGDVKLKHLETQTFSTGFVQSRYDVLRSASALIP